MTDSITLNVMPMSIMHSLCHRSVPETVSISWPLPLTIHYIDLLHSSESISLMLSSSFCPQCSESMSRFMCRLQLNYKLHLTEVMKHNQWKIFVFVIYFFSDTMNGLMYSRHNFQPVIHIFKLIISTAANDI